MFSLVICHAFLPVGNNFTMPHPHDAFQSVLVEQSSLLRRLLQTEDEPGAGNPVGVELVGRHRLEKLLLVHRHEAGLHHVVEGGEPLLDRRRDGPENEDHRQVHPTHQGTTKHPRLLIVAFRQK